jgi:hypothetical protein
MVFSTKRNYVTSALKTIHLRVNALFYDWFIIRREVARFHSVKLFCPGFGERWNVANWEI